MHISVALALLVFTTSPPARSMPSPFSQFTRTTNRLFVKTDDKRDGALKIEKTSSSCKVKFAEGGASSLECEYYQSLIAEKIEVKVKNQGYQK